MILLTSCKEKKHFTKITDDSIIKYTKDGCDILIYISDYNLKEENQLNNDGIDLAINYEYDKARKKFTTALSEEPNNPLILNNLGNIEEIDYNFEKAIEYFEKSLIISDSLYVVAGLNLGRTYSLIGEKEKSESILKASIRKTDSAFLKGICYIQLTRKHLDYGEIEKAKMSISKAKLLLENYSDFKSDLDELQDEITNYYN